MEHIKDMMSAYANSYTKRPSNLHCVTYTEDGNPQVGKCYDPRMPACLPPSLPHLHPSLPPFFQLLNSLLSPPLHHSPRHPVACYIDAALDSCPCSLWGGISFQPWLRQALPAPRVCSRSRRLVPVLLDT
jgi:hypothetical protein